MIEKTRYVGLPICGIELKSYYKDGKELVDYKGKTYEVGCETCDNHDADSCNSCGVDMDFYSLNTSSDAISISKGVTMFEKDAEEYIKKTFSSFVKGIREIARISFKDGAEFGYNKANEWHYVKDGDLPKEYDTVLVCTEFDQHKSCLICNYHYKKWWYANGKYDEDVIAWKEIVLPELKESE